MNSNDYQILQLDQQLVPPETGKRSLVLVDDEQMKVVLFAFARGEGLAEHVAPHSAVIQFVQGEAALSVGSESVVGKPGTWIRMPPKTPHAILASTPLLMSLTLLKR